MNNTLDEVKSKALAILTRREHSEFELRSKLEKKACQASDIDEVIAYLYEVDYLNEQRYVEMMLRHHFGRGQGPKKIAHLLRQNQVSNSDIQQAFEAFEGDWFELAAQVRQRRFGEPNIPESKEARFKEKSRQMRFLAGRGFDNAQIESAMSEF